MKKLIIKVIYDNCKEDKSLQEGWGFSALIETDDRVILFDTGNDLNAFFSNSEKMGIDYRTITDVVFSHKHYDHIAGAKDILEKVRGDTRVYLPKGFSDNKIPKKLQIQKVDEFVEVGNDVFSLVLKGGFLLYEQSLILQTEKGLVIITGCAHPGIVSIIKAAKERLKKPIYLVLGGFHLFRKNKNFIEEIIHDFQSFGVQKVAPCHCSGDRAIEEFQEAYQNNFCKIGTGSVLHIIC